MLQVAYTPLLRCLQEAIVIFQQLPGTFVFMGLTVVQY